MNSQGYSELREPIKTRENCYPCTDLVNTKVRYRCQKAVSLTLWMQDKIGYHNNDGSIVFVSIVFAPECLSRNPCQFFISVFSQRCNKARNSSTSYIRCLEWYHSIVYLSFRGRSFQRNARLRRPFCEWIKLNYERFSPRYSKAQLWEVFPRVLRFSPLTKNQKPTFDLICRKQL